MAAACEIPAYASRSAQPDSEACWESIRPQLLEQCARQGVPVTLGFDAHKPSEVGINYDQSLEALKIAGYSEITRFRLRKGTTIAL